MTAAAPSRVGAALLTLVVCAAPCRAADPPVSFAKQVAPLLAARCGNCHVSAAKGDFQMASYEALVKSGMVQRGAGRSSRLVEVILTGDMPRGGGRVTPAECDLLVRWIDAGAACDADPAARLDVVARGGAAVPPAAQPGGKPAPAKPAAAQLSDAELAVARRKAAEVAWRRAIPDEEAAVEVRDRVTVVGNLPGARLGALADVAAAVEGRVRADLVAGDGRLLEGGVVIFAFRNAYDYSAFWQEVVGGERPKGLAGHAGSAGDAVYGAMLAPADAPDGDDTKLLLAEQICGAALVGRGAPAWFARGAGRAVAARLYPRAPLAQAWRHDVPAAVREVGACAAFLGGHADPAAAAVAAGGFVGSLAATAAKLRPVVVALDGGKDFDDAFAAAFRAAPPQAYDAWAAKESRRKVPGK